MPLNISSQKKEILPLTTQVLIQNHEKIIEKTINSISCFSSKIIAVNIGSTDKTVDVCKKLGVDVIRLSYNGNKSELRNVIVDKTETLWQFYINPGEFLFSGVDSIIKELSIVETNKDINSYKLNVINNGILSKEIRLWKKGRGLEFVNPVFETIVDSKAKNLNSSLYSSVPVDLENCIKEIKEWQKERPFDSSAYYYEACILLSSRKYEEFLRIANQFLFHHKDKGISSYMTRYYCSLVYCYFYKNYDLTISSLMPCIEKNPLMAEFWCLLGDAEYYISKNYDKAKEHYENAIILGSRRPKDDDWSLEIVKYKKYPEKMIENCNRIKNNISEFKALN
jgi:tetratricopeptide (TPR) repeat protein